MKRKEHTIYNSDSYANYTDNDIIQYILEDNPDKIIDDSEIEYQREFLSQMDFDGASYNLNKQLNNNILCIASLGLWDGRHQGYKVIGNNLREILYQAQGYYKVYYDDYNVKAEDIHHDGTNYYTFRLIKDNVNIDNLLNKLYNGTATKADINNYTYSLRKEVKEIYGWR